MRREILSEAVKLNMERRHRHWWHRIVSVMGAMVVFVTTYALILPAITLESETICGIEEHIHSDACYYTPVLKFGRDFRCPLQLHTHTEQCYDEHGDAVCGYADFVVHSHDGFCVDEAGNLVCALEEYREHTHGDDCYETVITYTCTMQEGEGAHTHSESCYCQPELVCQVLESPGHIHVEDCYGEVPVLCSGTDAEQAAAEQADAETIYQEEHIHGEACFGNPELICKLPEAQPHVHEEQCYTKPELVCGLEEQSGHIHDDSCGMEVHTNLVCGKEEIQLHTHGEACVDENDLLICPLTQIGVHQHSDECYVDHIHSQDCYDSEDSAGDLTCPYHVHDSQCYDEIGQQLCTMAVRICNIDAHTHQAGCYPLEDDGLVEIRFEIRQEDIPFVQSETQFPATVTLQEGSTLEQIAAPAVTPLNPEGEPAVYLSEYQWITPDGLPMDPQMTVQEDLVLTLKLYPADNPEAAKLINACFMYGDEVLLNRRVNAGTPVNQIPNLDVQHRLDEIQGNLWRFEGWQYTDEEGNVLAVDAENTVIVQDTVYQAVFREYVAVTLYDIDSDGQEYEGSPLEIYVPLESTLEENKQILLFDGTPVTSCLWYTQDGQSFPMDTRITESIHLYTYSYTLYLNTQNEEEDLEEPIPETEPTEESLLSLLAIRASAEELTEPHAEMSADEGLSDVAIVKRRGVALTESDFLVDGVNYSNYSWQDASGNEVDTNDLVGTSLSGNYALTLAAASDYSIRYRINVTQSGVFGTVPTVGGESSLEDPYNTSDGAYTIRIPNPTQYMVTSGNKRTLYQFTGWKVSRNSSTIAAGETVGASWIRSNVDRNRTYVTLTAQWQQVAVTETVHFFVNLNCQVVDMEGNTDIPDSGSFTNSVFSTTTTVTGDNMKKFWQGAINSGYSTQYIVLRAENASQTEAIDSSIRRLINGHDSTDDRYGNHSVWKDGYNGTKIFQVDDFPSDEQVLAVVRDMVASGTVIRMNGVALKEEELTSTNFTVRWNVFKYDNGDGWHIDGILVGKQAYLTVKKTFLGDEDAIQSVKNGNYSITLDNTTNNSAGNLTLTLNDNETAANYYGYSEYDSATDTYTWTVPLQLENYYNIIENNYRAANDAVQTSAMYTISNSQDAFAGWETYPSGGIANVKAYSYANDVSVSSYQTVTIRNAYVKSDTLTINKIDMDTGHGLAGVSYRIADIAGQSLELYQKPGASYYSMKASDVENGFVRMEESVITTDRNGAIFLKLENGRFLLEEAFPTGYGGASKITVTVDVDDDGNVIFDEISSSDSTIEVAGSLVDKNTATLTIRNVSFPTSVTAQKIWTDSGQAQPVTVALFRNGVDMGSNYQIVLNSRNNWTHTWTNLPLYVDGAAANYTLREIKIGNTNHDPSADNDGYAGYIVAYDEMVYYKNGNPVSGPVWIDDNGVTQYADNAKLVVRNEVYRGQMMFRKVDGEGRPLAGATFRLYADPEQTQLVTEATSDEYGNVVFENLMPDTYYVMKESGTPEGYIGADSLYKVRLTSKGSTTIEDTDTGEALVAIVNYVDEILLQLHKINELENPLDGAVFTLEQQQEGNWTEVGVYVTDEQGFIDFGKLSTGSYRLTETRAPDGYIPLEAPITFAVENGKFLATEVPGIWGVTLHPQTKIYDLVVTNRTGYELPRTGGSTVELYRFAGLALSLMALLGLGYEAGRKKIHS